MEPGAQVTQQALPPFKVTTNPQKTPFYLHSHLSRKGLYPLHDGPVWVLGFTPKLQISEQPEVQRVPGPHQHRKQSFPVSQLGGAKESLPTDTKTIQTNAPNELTLALLLNHFTFKLQAWQCLNLHL